MPRSRSPRLVLFTVGVLAAASGTFAWLRVQPVTRPVAEAAAESSGTQVRDLPHAPWYGLQLLLAHLAFHAGPAPATQPNVPALAGILVDLDTGTIIWERNEHQRVAPASTIKVLTSMVVLHNFAPDKPITVTPDALFQAGDETKMYLKPGQTLTVQELLTGLLTVSANDAADVLAIDSVGMERFVGAMNAQALALGLHDTHVTSPVGLDDPAMYSSAYDLAVMAAIDERSFPLFASIVDTKFAYLPPTATHPAFFLDNLNQLLSMYPVAVGIKTGYTGNAGACEVGMAVRGGHHLLSVVMDGNLVYTESKRLLDWGFVQEGLASQLPPPSPSPSPSPSPIAHR